MIKKSYNPIFHLTIMTFFIKLDEKFLYGFHGDYH